MDWLALAAGSFGAMSLILLAVFDTQRHPYLHRLFLLLFILGSNPPNPWFYKSLRTGLTIQGYRCRFLCYLYNSRVLAPREDLHRTPNSEEKLLDQDRYYHHRSRAVRLPYRIITKLSSYTILTRPRSVAFGTTMSLHKANVAAVLEWCMFLIPDYTMQSKANAAIAVIAFLFTFYVISFFYDLRPKARTKEEIQREAKREMQGISFDQDLNPYRGYQGQANNTSEVPDF